MGLSNSISESDVKTITQEAISFFNKVDIEMFSNHYGSQLEEDLYKSIIEKYPVAWNALLQLGRKDIKIIRYKPVNSDKQKHIFEFKVNEIIEIPYVVTMKSGISPEFDESLKAYLQKILNDEIDDFFMLTVLKH